MDTWTLLLDVLVLLGVAMVLGAAFARLRQSAILGYLLAGTLLGPHAVHWIKSEAEVEAIAELGVALLLFGLGLEFSWRQLRNLGPKALVGGTFQIVLTAVLAAVIGKLSRLGAQEAVAVGAMVALSSTACVLRVLIDRAEIESIYGRNAVGILLVQDMAVVPLAVLVSAMGGGAGFAEIAWGVTKLALLAAFLVAVLFLLLNKVAVWLLATLTLAQNRELAILLAVVTGLGSAWAAHTAQLSPAVGAFVAGIFLGGSPFATQIRADIASLRVVLLTLFFSAVGMLTEPRWVIDNWLLVGSVTIGLVVGKAVVVWLVMWVFRQTHFYSVATGLCLAQVGEFSFVLAGLARGKVISDQVFMLVCSTAVVTLFITPYLISAAPWVGSLVEKIMGRSRRALTHGLASQGGANQRGADVVIIGFGPAGQMVGQALLSRQLPVIVVDLNPETARLAAHFGFEPHIGDAAGIEVLEKAHVGSAEAVVITLPDPSTVRKVIAHVRNIAPQVHIVARCRHHVYVSEIELAGAQAVIDEEQEVGRCLALEVGNHFRSANHWHAADDADGR